MLGIVDDERRRLCPQSPCAPRVPAARGRLRRCRGSMMPGIHQRHGALHATPRRTERDPCESSTGPLRSRFFEKSQADEHIRDVSRSFMNSPG